MLRHDISLNSFAYVCSSYFSSTNTLQDSVYDEFDELRWGDDVDKLSIVYHQRFIVRDRLLSMRRNAIVTENYLQENEHRAAVVEGMEKEYLEQLRRLQEREYLHENDEVITSNDERENGVIANITPYYVKEVISTDNQNKYKQVPVNVKGITENLHSTQKGINLRVISN